MNKLAILTLVGASVALSACEEGVGAIPADKSLDGGINAHNVSELIAGIWVDPNGCDHWIIDDGVEGYLSERLTPDGRPVCSGVAPPNMVVGPFKQGHLFPDPKGPQRRVTYSGNRTVTTTTKVVPVPTASTTTSKAVTATMPTPRVVVASK